VCELTIEDSTSPPEQSQQKWVEDLKLVQSRELGTVAIEVFWERLGIGETLRRIVKKPAVSFPSDHGRQSSVPTVIEVRHLGAMA
jgi:hypothetical protein